MSFTVSKGALNDAVAYAKSYPMGDVSPVYNIKVYKKYVTLSGGTEAGGFSFKMKADGSDREEYKVAGDIFGKVAAKAPNGIIYFNLASDQLVMESGAYKAVTNTLGSYELHDWDGKVTDKVPAKDIVSAIDKVAWGADKKGRMSFSNVSLSLNCISVANTDKGSMVVATDRNVMPMVGLTVSIPVDECLIPVEFIPMIKKFLASDSVTFGVTNDRIVIQDDNRKLYINKLTTPFVNYKTIVKTAGNVKFSIDLSNIDLLEPVKRVAILTTIDQNIVEINFEQDKITINSCVGSNSISEVLEVTDVDIPENFRVRLNGNYLINALVYAEDAVYLDYLGEGKPIVIRTEDANDFKCLIAQRLY